MNTVEELKKINNKYFNDELYVAGPIYSKTDLIYACKVGLANEEADAWINALTFMSEEINEEEIYSVTQHLLKWYPNAKDYMNQHKQLRNEVGK